MNARSLALIVLLPVIVMTADARTNRLSIFHFQNPSEDTLSQVQECRPRNGLPNFFRKLNSNQPVTIAYLGGSITEAANGYREQFTNWLQEQYPANNITAINAGIGGTGGDLGCFRLKSQVLDFHPELVFVEFAVNDKDTDTARVHETMEGIVRQIWKNDATTDICFVYTLTADLAPVLATGKLPPAARAMEDITQHYQIPSVDMCMEIVALFSKGDLVFKGKPEDYPGKMVFSADNVHPYAQTGHRLYTEALARSFQEMARINKAAPGLHHAGQPLTANRYENVEMIPAEQLIKTNDWVRVDPAKENAGILSPRPFPVLLKSNRPGASIVVRFRGTMIGLYDVVGPGAGKWDILLDGQLYHSYTRFDRFATYWRPNYVVVKGFASGLHTVEFRVSTDVLDKKSLLEDKADDLTGNPEKYSESLGYVGYLLLAGTIEK